MALSDECPIKINKIVSVNSWSYELKFNCDCTICRQSLNSYSIYSQEKGIDSCKILFGTCGHGFHKECILPWTQINSKCPICSQKWIIAGEVESNTPLLN